MSDSKKKTIEKKAEKNSFVTKGAQQQNAKTSKKFFESVVDKIHSRPVMFRGRFTDARSTLRRECWCFSSEKGRKGPERRQLLERRGFSLLPSCLAGGSSDLH